MTPQRELIFRSFFELGRHVSVDDVYDKVRERDRSIGYSTVWRNLKLICQVGLAEEVSLGDGVTRYDRVTKVPHGHYYCTVCKSVTEFNVTISSAPLPSTPGAPISILMFSKWRYRAFARTVSRSSRPIKPLSRKYQKAIDPARRYINDLPQ